MRIVRRISALALVVTFSLVGLPLSAQAGDEESPPVTLNGRSLVRSPLSDMLYGRVTKVAVALSEQPTAQEDEDEGNWWERRSGKTKGAIIGAAAGAGIGLGYGVALCGNEGGVPPQGSWTVV